MKTNMFNTIKRGIAVSALLLAPAVAFSADVVLHLDKAPISTEQADLQNGARIFVNYCLNCHSASYMRYNKLMDIGLDEKQILEEFLPSEDSKIGDLMTVAMDRKDAKSWFGVAPPDLTLTTRARSTPFGSGADWIYTYLRQFYRDPARPTGWNNVLFENVAMPHVLWDLQGIQEGIVTVEKDADGNEVKNIALNLAKPGARSVDEYNKDVADLVSFMTWMAEPGAAQRKTIGIYVLVFLALFFVVSYLLKKNYWKDVH